MPTFVCRERHVPLDWNSDSSATRCFNIVCGCCLLGCLLGAATSGYVWSRGRSFQPKHARVLFPWNDHDEPSNLGVLDDNARWLKNHPRDRFYIEGYASSRGDLIYNLALSQRRADWVKQALISKGISEDRIAIAVGWGELYPVCPEATDECWARNRLVRFSYSPN